MAKNLDAVARRKARVRKAVKAVANGRPRLSVFRSSKQIYAQIIDDAKGHTLAAASSLEKDMREKLKTGADKAHAFLFLVMFLFISRTKRKQPSPVNRMTLLPGEQNATLTRPQRREPRRSSQTAQ